MIKWEYKVVDIGVKSLLHDFYENHKDAIVERLNKLGEDGWELVFLRSEAAKVTDNMISYSAIMKREKQ